MADWRDILSDKEERLTTDDLLRYLDEDISEEEKSLLEEKAAGSFETDALAGLRQIKDKARLRNDVHQLNKKLPHLLRLKKQRVAKTWAKDLQLIILVILILFFLCIMTYVILVMHGKHTL